MGFPEERERKRLIDFFSGIGLLSYAQVEEALRLQEETGQRLGEVLVSLGFISSEDLPQAVLDQLGMKPYPLKGLEIASPVLETALSTFCYTHRVIPVKLENEVLTLATDNIFTFLAGPNLEKLLKRKINFELTTKSDFFAALERFYGLREEPVDLVVKRMGEEEAVVTTKEAEEEIAVEEAPIIRLVSLLIMEAMKRRVSDIHLEPLGDKFRVRYRIDGVLNEVPGPPKRLQGPVISRVKLMAGMDIAERRLPQDGHIRVRVHGKDLDLRVSTLPAVYGESVVLRILDKSSFLLGLSELGFLPEDQAKFEKLLKMPHGIMLDTGPTGCGKTTTLYAALNYINKPGIKIITVEDPVEYQITGINQVQIKQQIGLTFAAGLRSILRQAPDVIMVGEIRDYETAQIAIQAALTGHFVLSTLHTNDAPGAITRLVDMDIKPYLVASSVQAILAQRLVRVICDSCKKSHIPTDEEILALDLDKRAVEGVLFYEGTGCEKCSHTGYYGRIALFELLIMTDVIRDLIFKKAPSKVIMELARREGMKTLKEDGAKKVIQGMTTPSEVLRVAHIG